jgi:hypothetical protein
MQLDTGLSPQIPEQYHFSLVSGVSQVFTPKKSVDAKRLRLGVPDMNSLTLRVSIFEVSSGSLVHTQNFGVSQAVFGQVFFWLDFTSVVRLHGGVEYKLTVEAVSGAGCLSGLQPDNVNFSQNIGEKNLVVSQKVTTTPMYVLRYSRIGMTIFNNFGEQQTSDGEVVLLFLFDTDTVDGDDDDVTLPIVDVAVSKATLGWGLLLVILLIAGGYYIYTHGGKK